MDLLDEQALTLNEAAKITRSSLASVWRWCLKGVRGVELESYVIGARRYTTREAVERFISRTTAVATGTPPPERTRRQANAAVRQAHAELSRDGI